MPVLKNSRWEKFVQNKAEGMATGPAYTAAGYRAKGRSADTAGGRLLTIVEIRDRLDELLGNSADQIADVRDLARTHTTVAVETLAEIMKDTQAPKSARVQAATSILDRGWGKSPLTIEVEPTAYDLLTLDKRLAIVAALDAWGDDGDGEDIAPRGIATTKH